MTTPVLPREYLDLIDPLRSGADLRGRVLDVRPETADAATVVIRPGRGWLGHIPGQYIRIGVEIDGVRNWRTYSLTSPVDAPDGTIAITVKAIPDGVVSQHIVRRLQPGTLIMLDQATGDFVLPAATPTKALFLTAGSGITPVMGMLRNRPADLTDAVMLHSAPRPQDVIFANDLADLADTGAITLHRRHTDDEGMLDLAELDSVVPDWREREVWVCGPTGLLDAAEAHWAAAGLSERLHVERFRPKIAVTGEGGTVTFTTSDVVVEAAGDEMLLDVGEENGVLMPSGCRMGICFGCVSTLTEGSVRDLRTGELTTVVDDTPVTFQPCVQAAAGDCRIER